MDLKGPVTRGGNATKSAAWVRGDAPVVSGSAV
jgi:hypothetical protein